MTAGATQAEQRGLQALGLAMDELRTAHVPGADAVQVWSRTMHVLNLMHSLDDQAHRRLGADYRGVTRRATEDGRAQAGLTLVRGIAHHHGAEVQGIVLRGMGIFTARADGAWVPMTMHTIREGGELVPMKLSMPTAAWRPLAELPTSPEKHLHDREVYYADHVEGRDLLEPLLAAQRFLTGLQHL